MKRGREKERRRGRWLKILTTWRSLWALASHSMQIAQEATLWHNPRFPWNMESYYTTAASRTISLLTLN